MSGALRRWAAWRSRSKVGPKPAEASTPKDESVLHNESFAPQNWVGLAISLGLYVVFAFTYNTIDADLYLIPVWMIACWAIARGVLAVIEFVTRHTPHTTHHASSIIRYSLLIIFILFVPINSVIANFASMNLSRDFKASKFIQALEPQLPAHAILLTDSDAQTFTLWYYRAVEHWRPDLSVIDRRLAAYADWADQMLVNQGGAPNLVPFDPEETWPQRLRAANPDRPLCELSPALSKPEVKCD
jgi:hypothetical protein